MGKYDKNIQELLNVSEQINHIKDIDALLDRVLFEARIFTHSDAGSIYLMEGNRLKFRYVQNDSLFKGKKTSNKYLYTSHELEINEKSLAGYVVITGKPLNIDDVYKIPTEHPYSFNISFDEQTSYRSKSILTIPL